MTATSQRSAQRQKPKQYSRSVSLRASQVGLAVVHSITPLAPQASQPALEHNGTATANVRAHAVRALSRVLALVGLDILASQALRGLASALETTPLLAGLLADRFDALAVLTELDAVRFAGSLILGLVLAGAYGDGDRRRSAQCVLMGCIVAMLLPLWSTVWEQPAVVALQVIVNGGLLAVAVLGTRLLLDAVVYKCVPAPLARAVIVGTAEDCRDAAGTDDDAAGQGFSIAGTVHIDDGEELSAEGLRRKLVELNADTLLLCGQLDDTSFESVVQAAMMAECRVLATARRLALPGLSPKVLWMRGRPLIEMRAVSLRWQQLFLKRLLDVALASVLLVALAPVLLLITLAIVATSRGPAVYGQRRPGHLGRSFRCFKFRSMHVDAERRLRSDPELHAEFVANGFKLPEGKDPRITSLGRILRRTSLDELPQLWNVLRGDMSIVGPRPILPDEIAHYDDDCHLLLLLKPGITGLWQVSGRSAVGYRERIRLQLQYVERWSLGRDIGILLRTVPAVLAQQGAH